jgi:isocitrate/isopropylmalate dehydrogenase
MSKTTKEVNLAKLAKTTTLMNFVKKNKGSWDHQLWEELCDKIAKKYSPIDFDQVGIILEEKKNKYLALQKG